MPRVRPPMNAVLTPEALLAGCERVRAAGRGRFAIEVVRPGSAGALAFAAAAGDDVAARILRGVEDFLGRCGPCRTLCLHCPRRLRPCAAVILLRPLCVAPREAMTFGLCRGCAAGRSDQDIGTLALDALRRGLFYDLSELAVAPPGHA